MPRVGALFASVNRLFHSFTRRYEKHLCSFTEDFFGILRSVDVLRRVRASPAEFLVKRSARSIKSAVGDNSSSSVLNFLKGAFFGNPTRSPNRAAVPEVELHNTRIESF